MNEKNIGIVHGRFQPLHNGHLNDLILPCYSQCKYLYIGITNFDRSTMPFAKENPHRSLIENNPFSFLERFELIKETMKFNGISAERYSIIPFPINQPELLSNYVPGNAIHFMTIFDDWGRKKAQILRDNGYIVNVLFEKPLSEKKISSTMVREFAASEKDFKQLVPAPVYEFLSLPHIHKRLVSLKINNNI